MRQVGSGVLAVLLSGCTAATLPVLQMPPSGTPAVPAVFPAGTLVALKLGLRIQKAVNRDDLSPEDARRLEVLVDGQPFTDLEVLGLDYDANGQIVIRLRLVGKVLEPGQKVQVKLPNGHLALEGRAVSGGGVELNLQTPL